MKKSILSLVLIGILSIGAFLVTGKNVETVSFEGRGFAFKYPKNWTVQEGASQNNVTFDLPGEETNPYGPEQGEGTNPLDDINMRIGKIENLGIFFNYELITEEKPVIINKRSGYTFLESGMAMYRYYIFPLDENNYLQFSTPEDNTKELKTLLETLTIDPWIQE